MTDIICKLFVCYFVVCEHIINFIFWHLSHHLKQSQNDSHHTVNNERWTHMMQLNVWIADDVWNVRIFDDGIIMSNVLLLDSFWSSKSVSTALLTLSNLSLNSIFRQDQTTIRIQDRGSSWESLMWVEIMKLMAPFLV